MIFEGTFQGIFSLENIVMNGANVLQNSYLSYSCPFVKNLKIAGSAKEEGTKTFNEITTIVRRIFHTILFNLKFLTRIFSIRSG